MQPNAKPDADPVRPPPKPDVDPPKPDVIQMIKKYFTGSFEDRSRIEIYMTDNNIPFNDIIYDKAGQIMRNMSAVGKNNLKLYIFDNFGPDEILNNQILAHSLFKLSNIKNEYDDAFKRAKKNEIPPETALGILENRTPEGVLLRLSLGQTKVTRDVGTLEELIKNRIDPELLSKLTQSKTLDEFQVILENAPPVSIGVDIRDKYLNNADLGELPTNDKDILQLIRAEKKKVLSSKDEIGKLIKTLKLSKLSKEYTALTQPIILDIDNEIPIKEEELKEVLSQIDNTVSLKEHGPEEGRAELIDIKPLIDKYQQLDSELKHLRFLQINIRNVQEGKDEITKTEYNKVSEPVKFLTESIINPEKFDEFLTANPDAAMRYNEELNKALILGKISTSTYAYLKSKINKQEFKYKPRDVVQTFAPFIKKPIIASY